MSMSTWSNLLIGTWQSDTKREFRYPCYTFTPEGKFNMTMLAETYEDDTLNVVLGNNGSGRWRMFQAADETVLQLRFLEIDFGVGNAIFGKWNPLSYAIVFACGRLLPPQEFLVVSVEQDLVKVRGRIGSFETQETERWVRRRQPVY